MLESSALDGSRAEGGSLSIVFVLGIAIPKSGVELSFASTGAAVSNAALGVLAFPFGDRIGGRVGSGGSSFDSAVLFASFDGSLGASFDDRRPGTGGVVGLVARGGGAESEGVATGGGLAGAVELPNPGVGALLKAAHGSAGAGPLEEVGVEGVNGPVTPVISGVF